MDETTLSFQSGSARLAGTFVAPPGVEDGAPFDAALILGGSGPLDRDGNHKKLALNISRDLASLLADVGWGSLRYDKRGVGESEGTYLSTGFFDELDDATAALAWLGARPEVRSIVVVGHSGGALQAAELAVRDAAIAGAVLLATSAKTGEETLRWQTAQIQEHSVPAVATAVLKIFGTSVEKQQAKAVRRLQGTTGDTARIQLAKVNAKWFREYLAYDPMSALRDISIPTLAVTGSKDVQVDADDVAVVAATVPNATTAVITDVDHLLRHEPNDYSNVRKYKKQITKPIDPRVGSAISEWFSTLTIATEPTQREAS